MLSLREYRGHADRLADFLPWAALVAPGVVLNKDGSFQRTARFRGPDLDSATPSELVATTARLNGALRRLGSGWAVFVEAVRGPAQDYPLGSFPDPVSELVDRERAAQFAEEGAHFESRYFLTLLWLPPSAEGAQAESWLFEGKATKGVDPRDWLTGFVDRTDRLLRLSVASGPRPRRLALEAELTLLLTNPAPEPTPGFCPPEKFCGSDRMASPRSTCPAATIASRSSVTISLLTVAPRMRVPVTVMASP